MRLSTREKGIVAGGGVCLAAVGFWLAVWEPAQAHISLLERKVEAKRAELQTIHELADRFQKLHGQIDGIEADLRRSRNFSTLSFLEGLAKKQQIQEHIVQMKPKGEEVTRHYRENAVEVRVEKIRLSDLVQYLFQVENSPHLLRVKQLRIRPRFDNADLLDVRFQVAAYEPLRET